MELKKYTEIQWTEWDAIQKLMEFELSDCLLFSIIHYLQGISYGHETVALRKKNMTLFLYGNQ
jgi:hypothetical protein